MKVNNKSISTDTQGYLLNFNEWTAAVATEIAQGEKTTLTKDHWEIIYAIQNYYQDYTETPRSLRAFIKYLRTTLKKEDIDSAFLYDLFPKGPLKQACKLAGLPKPPHCI